MSESVDMELPNELDGGQENMEVMKQKVLVHYLKVSKNFNSFTYFVVMVVVVVVMTKKIIHHL